MKFKFLGLTWNFAIPLMIAYIVVGFCFLFWPFVMFYIGWWNFPIFICAFVWFSLAQTFIDFVIRNS